MAKQTGPVIWEKTIGPLSFYKRCGVGCVRMKSNLTAQRWRSDPAFAGSRKSAAHMVLAARLASAYYQTIPKHHRSYPCYKQLVGLAQQMFCKEYGRQQVNKVLHFAVSRYLRKREAADPNKKPIRSPFAATLSLKTEPVSTKLLVHQLMEPQRCVIIVNRTTFKQRPVIMPTRGSPAANTGCTQKQESCQPAPATAVVALLTITSHSQWQGWSCPYPSKSLLHPPKQPPKTPGKLLRNYFLPFVFL